MEPWKIRVGIWFFSDLKGEVRGFKRRDSHYYNSWEGHIHVNIFHFVDLGAWREMTA